MFLPSGKELKGLATLIGSGNNVILLDFGSDDHLNAVYKVWIKLRSRKKLKRSIAKETESHKDICTCTTMYYT